MPRNAYAAKLLAAKEAITKEERSRIIHRTINTLYQASAVVLNEQFGFGKERVERFRDALNDTVEEYGTLIDGADVDYADDKLLQRYQQIMGAPND